MNKTAQGMMNIFIYILVSIFGILVILKIIWNFAIQQKLLPYFQSIVQNDLVIPLDSATKTQVLNGFSNVNFMVNSALYGLFFVCIIALVIYIIRREKESEVY